MTGNEYIERLLAKGESARGPIPELGQADGLDRADRLRVPELSLVGR